MVDNFRPDILQRPVAVGWSGGAVAILDAKEEINGIPNDGTDYVLDQIPQIKLLKPFEHTFFVGSPLDPLAGAFDSDPHPTGTPEYVDDAHTTLPTKEQFNTGYVFYTRTKIRVDRNGGYYANWIINIKKLRADLAAQSNPPAFALDLSMQREYVRAFPPGDARPFKTATWGLRVYNIGIDQFQVVEATGQIVPIKPVLPTSLSLLVVPLAQEGQPGFPAPVLTVMPIPQHALFDGTTATFAAP